MDSSKKICLAKLSTSTKYKVDAKAKDRHGRTALQEAERCNHKRLNIKQNRIMIFQIFPQPSIKWQIGLAVSWDHFVVIWCLSGSLISSTNGNLLKTLVRQKKSLQGRLA